MDKYEEGVNNVCYSLHDFHSIYHTSGRSQTVELSGQLPLDDIVSFFFVFFMSLELKKLIWKLFEEGRRRE